MWCLHDLSPFVFNFQRFSAYSAASLCEMDRGRRGKAQKGRCGAGMTFRPSCANFSVFPRIQRQHFVQRAAEDAERRRRVDVMLARRFALPVPNSAFFSVFSGIICVQLAAEDAERRRREDVKLARRCALRVQISAFFSVFSGIILCSWPQKTRKDAEETQKSLYADWRVCEFACGMPQKTLKDAEERM